MKDIPLLTEDDWILKVYGKSGVFKTRNSISVEYVQTSLKPSQLKYIVPVREKFEKKELDFELMLQRDLDDERIRNELVPYLLRDQQLSFFPSILVVILEITKKSNNGSFDHEINELYPKLKHVENFEFQNRNFDMRGYGDLFNIKILKSSDKLERWYTELSIGHKSTLLAIDGQHRLTAIKAVSGMLDESISERFKYHSNIEKYKDNFSQMDVPITFIFMPASYKDNGSISLLSAFRQIFVDVNKNARQVSAMRNILLDENNFCSIFTRIICSNIREKTKNNEKNFITINEIEWDKESKETQLTDEIAITNIVFLEQLFKNWISDKNNDTGIKLRNNLGLESLKDELHDDDLLYDQISTSNFTQDQKVKIREVFEKEYLEGFSHLISSIPFALERSKGIKKIQEVLESKITDKTTKDASIYIDAKKCIFEGNEYKYLLKKSSVKSIVADLWKKYLEGIDRNNFLDMVRTNMFQKAFFEILLEWFPNYMENNQGKNFFSYCIHIKKVFDSSLFKRKWKSTIAKNSKMFEYAIKGIGQFSPGKSSLVKEYLKIFFKNNKEFFSELNLNFEGIITDSKSTKKKFTENYLKTLDAITDKIDINNEIKEFKSKFLNKVFR